MIEIDHRDDAAPRFALLVAVRGRVESGGPALWQLRLAAGLTVFGLLVLLVPVVRRRRDHEDAAA